jgi:hypothetical protein
MFQIVVCVVNIYRIIEIIIKQFRTIRSFLFITRPTFLHTEERSNEFCVGGDRSGFSVVCSPVCHIQLSRSNVRLKLRRCSVRCHVWGCDGRRIGIPKRDENVAFVRIVAVLF